MNAFRMILFAGLLAGADARAEVADTVDPLDLDCPLRQLPSQRVRATCAQGASSACCPRLAIPPGMASRWSSPCADGARPNREVRAWRRRMPSSCVIMEHFRSPLRRYRWSHGRIPPSTAR
jgi:hypothetical protein